LQAGTWLLPWDETTGHLNGEHIQLSVRLSLSAALAVEPLFADSGTSH